MQTLSHSRGRCVLSFLLPIVALLGGCTEDPSIPTLPDPVGEIEYSIAHGQLVVSWVPAARAESYLVELITPTSQVLTATALDGETSVAFDGLAPGDYQATVYPVSVSGGRGFGKGRMVRIPTESELVDSVTAMLPTSLHGTAKGMAYWYEHPEGFANQADVPYTQLKSCSGCHVFNAALTGAPADQPCLACHAARIDDATQPDYTTVEDAKCLKCHGRQGAEIAMGLPDVHRSAGLKCGDCHSGTEVHGGSSASTMFDVLATSCENCHRRGMGGPPTTMATRGPRIPPSSSHTRHRWTVDCQSCHQAGTVTCYNCHLAEEIASGQRIAYRRFADWTFLGNYRGKVYPLNYQSIQYEGETFNAWGPFHGHTVVNPGRSCTSCHANANMQALTLQGFLNVTQWDATTNTLNHLAGVIPVPPDYTSSLKFDYLNRAPDATWSFVEHGPDRSQMLYATPLTPTQIARLRTPR